MQTEIFAFDRGGEPLPETAALLLPLWRRERWERLRSDAARQESLAAGLLYARAMAARGLAPRETDRADVRPAGKPVLAERPDVCSVLGLGAMLDGTVRPLVLAPLAG